MTKEHRIYWITTESSEGDSVASDCYYLKDARKAAQKAANELKECVYINQGDDIIDVVWPDEEE